MMNPTTSRVLDTSSFGGGGPPTDAANQLFNVPLSEIYPGLYRLHQECCRLYPNQPNPLQLKSRVKFWDGGPDPLDYVSIYSNPGTPDGEVAPHWHYIGFGLSDLYGDGRVFPFKFPFNEGNSGFGFELTFRLKKDTVNPPVWPGLLLQKLATYTFRSGNPFIHGDHISWHRSLDDSEESRLQHMLVVNDPELGEVDGPFGKIKFIQIVGATIEELEAVQHWNGPSFLELMKQNPECGGRYLVTDLRRGESLFELDPSIQEKVTEGIMKDGSTLSGVTAVVSWRGDILPLKDSEPSNTTSARENRPGSSSSNDSCNNNLLEEGQACSKFYSRDCNLNTTSQNPDLSETEPDNFNDEFENLNLDDLGAVGGDFIQPPCHKDCESNTGCTCEGHGEDDLHDFVSQADKQLACAFGEASETQAAVAMSFDSAHSMQSTHNLVNELVDETKFHDNIHLTLNLEAALLIPLVVKGRIRHGRHFTFKSQNNDCAVTIVAPYVTGSYADMTNKFASRANWLQICLDEELAEDLLKDFDAMKKVEMVAFPTTIYSLGNKFALTVTL